MYISVTVNLQSGRCISHCNFHSYSMYNVGTLNGLLKFFIVKKYNNSYNSARWIVLFYHKACSAVAIRAVEEDWDEVAKEKIWRTLFDGR